MFGQETITLSLF